MAFVFSGFLVFCSQFAIAQSGGAKQTFPKLGGLFLAGKNYDDPNVQQKLARFDVLILGMHAFWNKGNHGSETANQRAALQAIKELNPDITLYNYTNINNARIDPNVVPFQDIYAKVDTEQGPAGSAQHWGNGNSDWWLRMANGSYSSNAPYAQNRVVNPTSNVMPDSNGDRFPEWYAKRNADVMFNGVPEWDGAFTDTVKYLPLYTADYDGNGTNDRWDDKDYWAMYRRPFKDYWDELRTSVPGILLNGNIGSWPFSERSGCTRCLGVPMQQGLPEFWQQLNGGLMEATMGETWSYEYWGSWQDLLGYYHSLMDAIIAPKQLLINVHLDFRKTETSPAIPKLQFFRYSFATTLMDDGYYTPSTNRNYNDGNVEWFDEFDLGGTSNTNWMGLAVDPPQATAWSKGVYRRDFQNAVALVNPKGNGTKTVTLEAGFRRILGSQDPVVNNGNAVTTVTLKERDGIILVRVGGNPPPPADETPPPDGDNGDGGDSGNQPPPADETPPPDNDNGGGNGDSGDPPPANETPPPDSDNGDNGTGNEDDGNTVGDLTPPMPFVPEEIAPNPPVTSVL